MQCICWGSAVMNVSVGQTPEQRTGRKYVITSETTHTKPTLPAMIWNLVGWWTFAGAGAPYAATAPSLEGARLTHAGSIRDIHIQKHVHHRFDVDGELCLRDQEVWFHQDEFGELQTRMRLFPEGRYWNSLICCQSQARNYQDGRSCRLAISWLWMPWWVPATNVLLFLVRFVTGNQCEIIHVILTTS